MFVAMHSCHSVAATGLLDSHGLVRYVSVSASMRVCGGWYNIGAACKCTSSEECLVQSDVKREFSEPLKNEQASSLKAGSLAEHLRASLHVM